MISAINLVKKFDNKTVVKNISFDIKKGEIFGLLGPSGAGKTTIIKMLTGQMKQTSGKVSIMGINNDAYDESIYSKIGMIMDDSGLYERLSCYDNLLLFARIYNVSKEKIMAVLKKVALQDDIHKETKKLSKGMKQRLIIARAILHSPQILFLDEPTQGLDPAIAKSIHELLFELRDKKTTIFLTTHNMEEATLMCDNVALLNTGVIVEYGNPEELCRRYNKNNNIQIRCHNDEIINIKNMAKNADKIAKLIKEEKVVSIHSSEPNLETVFLELTGRGLEQ